MAYGIGSFDCTVDFDVANALEQAIGSALTEAGHVDGDAFAVFVPADSEPTNDHAMVFTGDAECMYAVGEHDWFVVGRNVAEVATALRELLWA